MIKDDPGFLPPFQWRRQPVFGLPQEGAGRHAVVVSWHVAPDFASMPGQDRMLAIWAEPLLDALIEAGFRTTLLLVGAEGDPAATPLAEAMRRRGIHLVLVSGSDPLARCIAVDEALARLAPDVVHAPERLGVLAVALSRRAAGVAHLDAAMVLHARGPTLFQAEEQARFIGEVEPLLLDDLERQAMRLADRVLCCQPEVARYLATGFGDGRAAVECRMVAPLVWRLPPVAPARPSELVFPLPLASEAGLEFAVAAVARAAAKRPFPLPVTFLGQPAAVTIGNAGSALARLAACAPRLDWRVLIAETPQRAVQYLAQPGRVALLTAGRATPAEMLALCGTAGITVLTTANLATEEAARRWPSIHVLPRAERGFAAMLARLPALPEAMPQSPPPTLPMPELPMPELLAADSLPSRAMALLAEPEGLEVTLLAEARPSLLIELEAQSLRRFGVTLMLPPGGAAQEAGSTARPLRLVPGGEGALGRELARCQTRYAVLCGPISRLAPDALRCLLRAARASGAPAIAAWDSQCRPTGGGSDLALLRPGEVLGHVVLLDLPALRARGGASLATAGTPGFAAALAAESGGVMMLAVPLADATRRPPMPRPTGDGLLPPRLRGATALALHFAAPPLPDPLPDHASETPRAMAAANRETTHYLKLVGRLLDGMGLSEAAADVWRARLARDPDDGESWLRHATLGLTAKGALPDLDGLCEFVRRHGVGALGSLPEAVAQQAQDLLQAGQPDRAMHFLAGAAPALQDATAYIQAVARTHARLTRMGRPSALPRLAPAAHAALRAALEGHAIILAPRQEDEAA